MILKPDDYDPDILDSSLRPRMATLDILRLETKADHQSALRIVKRIMKHYNLTVKTIEQELDVGGVDWAKAGDQQIDLSFLVSVWF